MPLPTQKPIPEKVPLSTSIFKESMFEDGIYFISYFDFPLRKQVETSIEEKDIVEKKQYADSKLLADISFDLYTTAILLRQGAYLKGNATNAAINMLYDAQGALRGIKHSLLSLTGREPDLVLPEEVITEAAQAITTALKYLSVIEIMEVAGYHHAPKIYKLLAETCAKIAARYATVKTATA